MAIAVNRARAPEGGLCTDHPPVAGTWGDGPRNPSLFAIGSVSGVRIVKIEIVTLVVMAPR